MRALAAIVGAGMELPLPARSCGAPLSVGAPWRGRLECGRRLPTHPRLLPWTLNVYGTSEAVDALTRTADDLDQRDPGGPAIDVFDLSGPGGGRIRFHKSHQSGRDVDVGFAYVGEWRPTTWEVLPPPGFIDTERTWQLVEALIATGRVKRVFVDYEVQARLYERARAEGRSDLGRVFQYPRGPGARSGIVRHEPFHKAHLHVRFHCPRGQRSCRG